MTMTPAAVRATKTITEHLGDELVTHALPGDLGQVVHADDEGFPTVYFDRSGTATIVSIGEDAEWVPFTLQA